MNTFISDASRNVCEEASLEMQRENFVASISHDLKNPTIAQIRALELFLKGCFGKIPPKQREIIEMVLSSCKYMNSMLCSLLATYRFEKGTLKLACDEISILELTKECSEEILYLAKDKGINILINNEAKNEFVYGDRIQLKRVIMNLISNGIKYAYKNTNLCIYVYNEDNKTCFRFKNKSPYISPEKQKEIFARYVTYSQSNNILGIGLGLYASKKIVEAHYGEIFVKSYKDNTTIFGFKIPNTKPSQTENWSVTF